MNPILAALLNATKIKAIADVTSKGIDTYNTHLTTGLDRTNRKLEVVDKFGRGRLTTTDAAIILAEADVDDGEINRIVSRSHKSHGTSGISYDSGNIKWVSARHHEHVPFIPKPLRREKGAWKGRVNGGPWQTLPPSGSRPGSPLGERRNARGRRSKQYKNVVVVDTQADTGDSKANKELDKLGYTQIFDSDFDANKELDKLRSTQVFDSDFEENKELDRLGSTQAFDCYFERNNEKKGDIGMATEFANSFSEEATENPKLQRDLEEGEVDSYSNTHAYELPDSPPSDSPPTSPFLKRGQTQVYESISPTYTIVKPGGFGHSILGRGVIIFCVVALIGVIVEKLVSKGKEPIVDIKQTDILAKEEEERVLFSLQTKFVRMLPFLQTYYLRRDSTLLFTLLGYQNKSLTWSQANRILRESCGVTEEAIQDLLPLQQNEDNS